MCQRQALRCDSHSLPSFARGGGGKPRPPELGRYGGDYGSLKNPREHNRGEEDDVGDWGVWWIERRVVEEEDVEVGWEGAWKGTSGGRRIRVWCPRLAE